MAETRRRPEDCNSMAHVRDEIDRLDREIVALLARRQGYVRRAGHLKARRDQVRDPARIEDVVAKVRGTARQTGADEDLIEAMWRAMIERMIAFEYGVFDDSHSAGDDRA